MLSAVTGILTGMEKSTIANNIHTMVIELITNPNLPSEKVLCATAFLPRTRDTRIGIPYEHDKHIVAQPVNELKAAVEPK